VSPVVLTGRSEEHLCSPGEAEALGARVHRDVVAPFLRLRERASEVGFDLRILSGFRGFEHQLAIWNGKASGERPVLDSDARLLDIAGLDERELVFAILRWSALPGASRHHWGTDLDVYDEAGRPEGYEIELVPEEVEAGGMFAPLHEWLDARMAAGDAEGFFRPYDSDRGGVAPERWHLSYGPIAGDWTRRLTADALRAALRDADLALEGTVLAHLDEIVERFVANVNPAFV
jgi:LAS superfamily LD-carboxypeptidase LdcB